MNLGSGGIEALRRIHYKIGAPALFLIGELFGQQAQEPLLGHPGAGQNAAPLFLVRSRYDDHDIDAAIGAGFE